MKTPEASPQQKKERTFLNACLLLAGACTLVLEIVGARLISPFYGSSLYCWSALITVTLLSLAAGYHWGGRLADRGASLASIAKLLSAAALTLVVIPEARATVLRSSAALGIQLGAVAAAAAFVAPALVLLSALGPVSVRLTARELGAVGRSAGNAYALSTIGSVAGAIAAGFWLVPRLPLALILRAEASLLLLLAAWAQYLSSRREPWARAALAAAIAAYGYWPRVEPATNVIHNKESAYGQIKVLDFGDRRYLLLNGTTQAMAFLDTMRTDSEYVLTMEWAAAVKPGAGRALVIGLGAGLLTSSLERDYRMTADSVDLDPEMEVVARRYFGFEPKGRVYIEDGRALLERGGPAYDLIFLDAFGTEMPPFHLFTAEAFAAMRRRLAPGGMLAVNLVSMARGDGAKAWRSAHRTLASVFPHVRAYEASTPMDELANIVFFCGVDELPEPRIPASARQDVKDVVAKTFSRPLEPGDGPAELMTDDFAPMEALLAKASTRWRIMLQEKIDSVLLH